MNSNQYYIYISKKLIAWYQLNKRDLPWRDITDPYKIWISEIILQQTRVNQGLEYYLRFVERFPTINLLSEAHEDEVLKYWQGLGYYSRARNLHKATRQITEKFDGKFPQNHQEILQLSGIGDYTAAAISSFAFNQPFAVVDGNVYRVLSRLFGISTPIDSGKGKKEFADLAQHLLSKSEPATHNQAIMEFGALYCLPSSPDCNKCIFNEICIAFAENSVTFLPVKQQKMKVTNRYFNYLFIIENNTTFLQKRTEKDVWQNLYEFPLIETDKFLESSELIHSEEFQNLFSKITKVEMLQKTNPMKHVLSHRVIYAQFFTISISESTDSFKRFEKTDIKDIDNYAVSRLMELFLEKL